MLRLFGMPDALQDQANLRPSLRISAGLFLAQLGKVVRRFLSQKEIFHCDDSGNFKKTSDGHGPDHITTCEMVAAPCPYNKSSSAHAYRHRATCLSARRKHHIARVLASHNEGRGPTLLSRVQLNSGIYTGNPCGQKGAHLCGLTRGQSSRPQP